MTWRQILICYKKLNFQQCEILVTFILVYMLGVGRGKEKHNICIPMHLIDLKGFLIIGAPILYILSRIIFQIYLWNNKRRKSLFQVCSKQGRRSLNLITIINTVSSSKTESTCFHDILTLQSFMRLRATYSFTEPGNHHNLIILCKMHSHRVCIRFNSLNGLLTHISSQGTFMILNK